MGTWDAVRGVLFVVFGAVTAVLAPVATALTVLLLLMALDLVSALIANGKRGELDPGYGWGGWRRKANTVIIVLGLAVLQTLGANEGLPSLPAAQVVAGGFCILELLSIVKNGLLSGVRLPGFVEAMFAKLEQSLEAPSETGLTPRG